MESALNLTPQQRYQSDLALPGFFHDEAQQLAVDKLQNLYDRLVDSNKIDARKSFWRKIAVNTGLHKPPGPLKGLYFWGGVGRGKTYLMDNFYASLPFDNKMRAHFHRFMRRIHSELKALYKEKNPLQIVAKQLAKEARVICFDEFFVSDITDAMLIANLLRGLFENGVTLVATSNILPDKLYQDGLQRERFLPAIDLLNIHTEVVNIDGGRDYRLRCLQQAELYHWPLDDAADNSLLNSLERLVPEKKEIRQDYTIEVEGRQILCRYHAEDVVWFEFVVLCDGPRSQNDYIEIAREYHAVIISNIPQLTETTEDQARRFINLVDEFYDRNIKLILSAEKPLNELYKGAKLRFEFERTVSRLLEMQSHEYLARQHKA